jgi:FKBP-type peptidyl-prolyl cis-trans isomerase
MLRSRIALFFVALLLACSVSCGATHVVSRYVIAGFDQGIVGMRAGGIRTLIIPAQLAYGATGFPGSIPPNSALKSNIHLLQVQ